MVLLVSARSIRVYWSISSKRCHNPVNTGECIWTSESDKYAGCRAPWNQIWHQGDILPLPTSQGEMREGEGTASLPPLLQPQLFLLRATSKLSVSCNDSNEISFQCDTCQVLHCKNMARKHGNTFVLHKARHKWECLMELGKGLYSIWATCWA